MNPITILLLILQHNIIHQRDSFCNLFMHFSHKMKGQRSRTHASKSAQSLLLACGVYFLSHIYSIIQTDKCQNEI